MFARAYNSLEEERHDVDENEVDDECDYELDLDSLSAQMSKSRALQSRLLLEKSNEGTASTDTSTIALRNRP